jgi:hypothetical protein
MPARFSADIWANAYGFFSRHGGARGSGVRQRGSAEDGSRGWWQLDAADGYRLRCDWFSKDGEEQLTFRELSPP